MKILWLINVPLPEASILLNEKPFPFGSWLINQSRGLADIDDISLHIAFPVYNIKGYRMLKGNKITYYAFRMLNDNDKESIESNDYFKKIIHEVKPDLVHIHGTEFVHTLSMVNVCNSMNIDTVISIQGLCSIIEKHMYSNLPINAVYGFTFRNFFRRDNVAGLKTLYRNRGKNEVEAIKKAKYIIGRTTWDKACISQINPFVQYYHCNESIRDTFYHHQWDLNNCEKYSLFLSQGQYPIKGLHYVIEAMPIILKKYKDTKLYIGGKDITNRNGLKNKLLMSYYGKYIYKLIKKHHLEDHVIFTGVLDEEEMCQRFIKTHVFISPSTIENESNSLSEAKILGIPSVASYVGGVTDRINHYIDGIFYQHDAPYMLAYYVCEIFGNDILANTLSKNARENASKINDVNINVEKLVNIYHNIIEKREYNELPQ